jgi:integrase
VSSTDLEAKLSSNLGQGRSHRIALWQREKRTNKIESFPKVKTFLDSIARNSIKSKRSYSSGLSLLQNFLNENEYQKKYADYNYNCETILQPLSENRMNVYELLDSFVSYLIASKPDMTPKSIRLYLAALRSYFAFYDVDVIPSKFRRKVKVPKYYREDEEPLDAGDIRKILLHCNNRRLKAYLLTLASGGMRTVEALAIRLRDVDFSFNPTKIHIRKEYAKTKVARDVYISEEATQYLEQWIDWKYKNGKNKNIRNPNRNQDDLVFTHYSTDPNVIYVKIYEEFQKLLAIAGMDERKEGMGKRRRKITLHSLRRFVKTVISNQVNQDYSEMILGHSKSPYFTLKESERREIYSTKVMRYLTFLDYDILESTGKNIEAKLSEKEKEIQLLRQRDSLNTDAIASLSDQLAVIAKEIEMIKKQKHNYNLI